MAKCAHGFVAKLGAVVGGPDDGDSLDAEMSSSAGLRARPNLIHCGKSPEQQPALLTILERQKALNLWLDHTL